MLLQENALEVGAAKDVKMIKSNALKRTIIKIQSVRPSLRKGKRRRGFRKKTNTKGRKMREKGEIGSQMERPEETDEDLIQALREGRGEALDTLLMRYKETVKRRAQRYYLMGGDREDLLQEGMIGLYKAICD